MTATLSARDAWLEARKSAITGTDIAKLIGVSKFGGPMDVYLDKIGEGNAVAQTEAMAFGHRFERPILEAYEERENVSLEYPGAYELLHSRTFDCIAATLDAFRVEDHAPVDAKNIRWQTPEWGEDGTDEMPLYYAAQLVWQQHVSGATFADLAVLFSGQDLRVYRLHRDDQLMADLLTRAVSFWNTHVVPRVPPPIDGSASWTTYLKERITQASEQVIAATPELHQVACELARVETEEETIAANKALLQNTLKAAIGEAKGIVGATWKATWSQAKDTMGADFEAVALDIAGELLGSGYWKESPPTAEQIVAECAARHQKITRKGARSFRFTFKG